MAVRGRPRTLMAANAPRRDPAAIAALALSVLACCPVVSLLGVLMGSLSLVRIRASGGALTGRGLAWTAIAVSVVVGIGSSTLLERVSTRAQAEISSQTRLATTQLFGDGPDPGAWWPSGMAAGARAFGDRIRSELGLLKSVTTAQGDTMWTGTGAQETLRLHMTFERGDVIGATRIAISADPSTWTPTISMRSIELGASPSLGFAGASYPEPESAPRSAEEPSPEPR
jgi:hypothetical protein